MKRAKKARARKPAARSRGVPHMIYLSEEETARFLAKAEARGKSKSELLRFWVNQESRRKNKTASAAANSGTPADPRQTSIDDIAQPQSESEALREWASDWLQEKVS